MTLTEFLLARIAEDEAVAKNVTDADYSDGHWRWEHHGAMPYRSALLNDRGQVVLPPKNDDVYPSAAVAAHITSHDPARVQAECEAKRRIVELHPEILEICQECASAMYPCRTLRALALPYADHPDYDEAWRP